MSKSLEIGCGDGEFTKRLATLGREVIATDVTLVVVQKGRGLLRRIS